MKSKIYLSSPHMSGLEQPYVNEAFESNWIAPLGPNVNGFEQELQQYTGSSHAAALSAGTAAIHLALILSDVKPGDLVICQSFTFSATANPIAYLGAKPVFVDSEPDTWNMSPELLEVAIQSCLAGSVTGTPQPPKAILAVHLYGMPAKMNEIMAIADKYGIPLIEDAAEALGSMLDGKKCGTFGKFGILSFNGNKIITTSGGGALLSNDQQLIEKARFLATQARDNAPHYQHSHIGYNYRMSNIVAGIGRGQLKVIDDRVASRRANFERYRQYFASLEDKGYHIEFQGNQQSALSTQQSALSSQQSELSAPLSAPSKPGIWNPEHGTENREPGTENSSLSAPLSAPSKPGTWNPEHGTENRELGTEHSSLSAPLSALSDQNGEPRTENRELGTWNPEHGTEFFTNRWLTAIIIDPLRNKGITREDLRLAFEAENIESRPLWKPMHMQPIFADCPFFSTQSTQHSAISSQSSTQHSAFSTQSPKSDTPSISKQLFNNGLCLPSGSNLTEEDWERIFEVLRKVFK